MRPYVSLAEAAERIYRELTGAREPIVHPTALDAAVAALSAFAPIHGDRVAHADLESALATLRRAGVCFSEVRA